MLYMVNKSPFSSRNLESCLHFAPSGSPIMLYEDGVYAATTGTRVTNMVQEALINHAIYALEVDLQARGLGRLIEGVQVVGYDIFVDLVAEHNVVPWL